MLEKALHSILVNDAAVSAIVDTRVYPIHIPQNASYPAVTYFRVSADRARSTCGADGECRARMQIDCWAKGFEEIRDLSDAIRKALDGYAGIVSGVKIGASSLVFERDAFENRADYYRSTLDFLIGYEEN